jgi:hypothetical protein
MARDKTDKTPAATLATTATQKGVVESRKPLVGLLGGELDFFAVVGLGFGASDRAKELVLKGLVAELVAELDEQIRQLKPKRGRPRKGTFNIDLERAAAVLAADDFLRDKDGRGARTQKEAIEIATQIDRLRFKLGLQDKRLFGVVSDGRYQDSVSKGLGDIGEDGKRFLKKSP